MPWTRLPRILSPQRSATRSATCHRGLLPRHGESTLDELENFILIVCLAVSLIAAVSTRTGGFHRLYLRGNPGPGILRLGVIVAMAWIAFVLWRYADESVTGIYVLFYLVMGYAVVKVFGQRAASLYGARLRVDVVERRNVPAAVLVAVFTLGTGLIFGGSLWGEADPVGDDEGGWWIPLTFFLLGWTVLLMAFALFLRRESGRLAHRIQRDRSMEDVRAAAFFLLAAAVTITDAVSGDFWGWRHGLLTFGVLGGLVVVHEAFAGWAGGGAHAAGRSGGVAGDAGPSEGRRVLEAIAYTLMGLSAWGLNRFFDRVLGGG